MVRRHAEQTADNSDRQDTLDMGLGTQSGFAGCSLIHPAGCSASLSITSSATATFVPEGCAIFLGHLTAS